MVSMLSLHEIQDTSLCTYNSELEYSWSKEWALVRFSVLFPRRSKEMCFEICCVLHPEVFAIISSSQLQAKMQMA